VLIHGAFQTAATWDLVAARLEAAGRRVVVAALAGLESDANDLADAVALDTHIRDVAAPLKREDLQRRARDSRHGSQSLRQRARDPWRATRVTARVGVGHAEQSAAQQKQIVAKCRGACRLGFR
jgi:hypothetical protein